MLSKEDKTEQESKVWYQRVWDALSEYRQKNYIVTIFHGKRREYVGVEVFATKESMDAHVEHIKGLLAGKGYSVTGNTNSETITIQ